MNELQIDPEHFFAFEIDCSQSLKQLPCPQELFGHESFAKVFMSWNEEGLSWKVQVALTKDIEVAYPQIREGDSFELFIDTRDVKQARTTHRYCHHFFFLPERFEGISRGEITKFRTEDTHEHCQVADLELETVLQKSCYQMNIFIPKSALCGYDPQEGAYLGFCYRLCRSDGALQLFGFPNDEISIEKYPYLWSRVCLKT